MGCEKNENFGVVWCGLKRLKENHVSPSCVGRDGGFYEIYLPREPGQYFTELKVRNVIKKTNANTCREIANICPALK